jgi:hypothetical protein
MQGGLVGVLSSWMHGPCSYLPWLPSLSSPSLWSPLHHCPSGWCCGPSSVSVLSSCCPCPFGSRVLWWWWSCPPHPHCLLLLSSLMPRSSSLQSFMGGSSGSWVVPVILSLSSWLSWLWSWSWSLAPPPSLLSPMVVVPWFCFARPLSGLFLLCCHPPIIIPLSSSCHPVIPPSSSPCHHPVILSLSWSCPSPLMQCLCSQVLGCAHCPGFW